MVAPVSPAPGTGAAPSVGARAGALLGWLIRGLQPAIVRALQATLLHPFVLGPGVQAAWSLTRDIAGACLLAALLYGLLQTQIGQMVGLDAGAPWRLLPRLGLASLGVVTSLPLAEALLAANNALVAALVGAVPPGPGGVVRPTLGVLTLAVVPSLLSVGSDVAALIVLVGIAALACFYVLRAAEIVLLTLMLPLAAMLWVVPAAAGVWRALLAELLVSIFVQAAQALVLIVFAAGMGLPRPAGGASWLWALGALALLFRCRRLLATAVRAAAEFPAGGPSPRTVRVVAERVASLAAPAWRAGAERVRQGVGM